MGTVTDGQQQRVRTETAEIITAKIARERGVAALNLYFEFGGSRRQGIAVEPSGRVLTKLYRICESSTLDECEGETVIVDHNHRRIVAIRDVDEQNELTFYSP